MTILPKSFHRQQAGRNGIEVDVMANRSQRPMRFDDQCLVSPLKQVPALVTQPVEPGGKGRLQPVHARDEVSARGFQRQMKVIAHEYERVQPPLRLRTGVKQARFKRCFRPLTLKNGSPVVAAVDHVITRTREFQPELSRHPSSHDEFQRAVNQPNTCFLRIALSPPSHRIADHDHNCLDLTPYVCPSTEILKA